jgi:hypothetical protein
MNVSISKIAESENCLAIVDSRYPNRWLDAWGDVEKDIVDTLWRAGDYTVTATGTSPITASVLPGAVALITSGGSDFDGDNIQRVGTRFQLSSGKPCYWGGKFTINEATQSDLLVGLCGTDTTLTAASSAHAIDVGASGIFFSKMDNSTAINFKTYQTATETNTASAGTMDVLAHIYEIYFDGSKAFGYVDGVLVGTFTSLLPTVVLCPSVAFRTGSGAAKTCTMHWMRTIQVRS